jgi:uncharacterized damage-inducible protein DinB
MRSRTAHTTLVVATLLLFPRFAIAQHEHAARPEAAGYRAMINAELTSVEKKVIALAEAFPADKYGWRPAEGVRSVAEGFMHVAQGNYFLPTFGGTKPPEGLDLMKYDKAASEKKEVVAAVRASYDHVRKFVDGLSDADLAREVDFFGQKKTLGDLLLTAVAHSHEHLGQEIAYARMNGVTPPWSQ